jgi:hypothetical protein
MKDYNEGNISKGQMYCYLIDDCSRCHKCHVEDLEEMRTYYCPGDRSTYYSDKEEFGPGENVNMFGQLRLVL